MLGFEQYADVHIPQMAAENRAVCRAYLVYHQHAVDLFDRPLGLLPWGMDFCSSCDIASNGQAVLEAGRQTLRERQQLEKCHKQMVERVKCMSRMEYKSFSPQTEDIAKKRLQNGIEIYQNNEGETEFLYNEIFQKKMYFKHGITLPDHGTVMDVGANIGMFTLYVSSKSNCRVYAFEPLPPTFELLKMNTSSLPRVTTVNVGLSNEIKEAEFAYFPTMSTDSVQIKYRENHDLDLRYGLINHYRDHFDDPRMLNRFVDQLMSPKLLNEQIHRCKLTTISEMIRYYDLNPIDLLKIDVEKSEFEVLEGIEPEDWGKIRQIVMEVHGLDGEQISRLENIFRTNGFNVLIDYYEDLNIPNYYNVYALNQMHISAG